MERSSHFSSPGARNVKPRALVWANVRCDLQFIYAVETENSFAIIPDLIEHRRRMPGTNERDVNRILA